MLAILCTWRVGNERCSVARRPEALQDTMTGAHPKRVKSERRTTIFQRSRSRAVASERS